MGWIPSVEEARNWLWDYNTEPFHRQHGEIVGAVLGVFAAEYAPRTGSILAGCGAFA